MNWIRALVIGTLMLGCMVTMIRGDEAEAGGAKKFYIALDTNPAHFRNRIVSNFVNELKKTTGTELDIRVFHSGQLFKGRDELKGLAWGNIQMAVPGILSLSRFETNLNLFTLPAFYGLPYSVMRQLANGPTFKRLNNRIEQNLPVKVIGPYLELGYLDTFSVGSPVRSVADYAGMKVRVPGGAADIVRYKLLGANPVAIPFADVPLALSQGGVDGISSSYETVKSGLLWDTGLLYAFEDRAAYFLYIPLVSDIFWQQASPRIREAILDAWSRTATKGQEYAEEQQQMAKAEFIRHGGQVIVPDQMELEKKRQELLSSTPRIIQQLDMDSTLVSQAIEEIDNYLKDHPLSHTTIGKGAAE